jgi:hypothetical protein
MIILVVIALVILISIVMFIQKVVLKGRLENRLARIIREGARSEQELRRFGWLVCGERELGHGLARTG